jgi:hypothetical protein
MRSIRPPIFPLALICVACSQPPYPEAISQYYSSDKGTVLILMGARGYLGQNPSAPDSLNNKVGLTSLLTPLDKYSLNGGSCIAYESFTFAIKLPVKAGDRYQCNGVSFRVLACNSASSKCRRFVVEARCFDFTAGKCNPEGSASNLTLFYRYVYDVEKGILSVDFAPGASRSGMLRLAGDSGFRL